MSMKQCEFCQAEFESKNPNARFCNAICREKAKNKRSRTFYANLKEIVCCNCQKLFMPKKGATSRTKYCSLKCQQKVIRNKAIVDGRKRLSFLKDYEVNSEVYKLRAKIHREQKRFSGLREYVLKRDNYKCCVCSSSNNLEVHHIDGIGRNHKSPNNNIDNLQTLCSSCHGIQTNKDMGRFVHVTKEQMQDAISKTNTLKEAATSIGVNYVTFLYKKKQFNINEDVTKNCKFCNKIFQVQSKRRYTLYCSSDCAKEADKNQKKIKAKEKLKTVYRNCIMCNIEFEVGKYTPNKKLCSKLCASRYGHQKARELKEKLFKDSQ